MRAGIAKITLLVLPSLYQLMSNVNRCVSIWVKQSDVAISCSAFRILLLATSMSAGYPYFAAGDGNVGFTKNWCRE
jgi:hypothetical protein